MSRCASAVSASSPAPALSRFLGAGLHLSQLSHFRGPAQTGDFDTWLEQRIHLQAFGVTFRRSDIEESRPTRERQIMESEEMFLDEGNILQLKSTKARFDFAKLIRFCEELNDSYRRGNYLACILLIRAVMNHVPPIFGVQTFSQVVAGSGKSVKAVLSSLEDEARPIADLHTHILIRAREPLPTKHQVEPYKASFEILIHEILTKTPAT
jgi:hypothetical protein